MFTIGRRSFSNFPSTCANQKGAVSGGTRTFSNISRLVSVLSRQRAARRRARRKSQRILYELERRQVRDRIRELNENSVRSHRKQVERRRHRPRSVQVAIAVTPMPVIFSHASTQSSDVLVADNFSLTSIRPFGRCNRRPNPASSSPTPLFSFETFRMISWPHFDRLSTKR